MRHLIYPGLLCFVLFSSCKETRIHDHPEWKEVYESKGIKNACIIIRDHTHDALHYYNKERCTTRFAPASTFKIFNSLVALEVPVAMDDQMVIKWDSVVRERPELNKDLTMREAFKVSSLPYYQEIARRIGADKMQHYLDTVKYGNMKMGGAVDQFWLNDTLQISADEQLGFVKKLYFDELPFSDRSQRIVRSMMLQDEAEGYRIYYKTGTQQRKDSSLYWVVGYVEKIEHVHEDQKSMNKSDVRNYPFFFAQNFIVADSDKSRDWFKTRIEILYEICKKMEIIAPAKAK
jgi:beta-lactamase class D